MTSIYLDIETIPSQDKAVIDTIDVKPPATIKKQETLDKWYAEEYPVKLQEAQDKMSLDGLTNQIIVIGLAFDDSEVITIANDDEYNLLNEFYHTLKTKADAFGNVFIGHNILGFDLNVIKKRSIIENVIPDFKIPFAAKPWDDGVYDTMLRWDVKNFTSQDKIALALGLGGKGDMNGSMVYQYWKDGRIDEIKDYCKRDVESVRRIHKRMNVVC